jgi:cbb3-type cytochrome oxidase maturation protein
MEILIMQVFVSLILVGGSVILFLFTVKQRDFDHADRLALMPVDTDDEAGAAAPTSKHAVTEGSDKP